MLPPGERKLASCAALSMRLAKKLDLMHVRRQLCETLASLAHPQDMRPSRLEVSEVCAVCEKLPMQIKDRAAGIILRQQQTMAKRQVVIEQLQAELQKCLWATARPDGAEDHLKRDVKEYE